MKHSNNIRLIREVRGYSQKYVAYKLSISQSAFSKLESGITSLTPTVVAKLSQILKVSEEFLTTEKNSLINFNYSQNAIATEPGKIMSTMQEIESVATTLNKMIVQFRKEWKYLQKGKSKYKKSRKLSV